jgi:hypothetical protein
MNTNQLEKIITLNGNSGALWESSCTLIKSGTVDELKKYFKDQISTGYQILVEEFTEIPVKFSDAKTTKTIYKELVPYEFFEKIGEYIIKTLELDDLLKTTGTLQSNNAHLRNTDRPEVKPGDKLYEFWNTLTTDEFKNSKPKERMNVFKDHEYHNRSPSFYASAEQIRETAKWITGTNFMWGDYYSFGLRNKYSELKSTIKNIWNTDVYEKTIVPFLDKIFAEK